MPWKMCRHIGCNKLSKTGWCEDHKPTELRASSYKRGYGSKWRTYRKAFLSANPLCAECERNGRITVATVVDHIVPHKGSKRLFWDEDNHEALCERCHNRKTAKEDMSSWDTHKGLV